MSAVRAFNSNRRLGELASQVFTTAGIIGLGGVAASLAIAQFTDNWERFFRSYLMAFMFVLSLSLGALFFTMLQHVTRAGWSVVIRRLAEGFASNLIWIWLLFIPVVIGMLSGRLYDWVNASPDDPLLGEKVRYYLNPTFWTVRAAVFLGIWAGLAAFFFRTSVSQDQTGEVNLTKRMERLAPAGLLIYALSQSFASMDWMMSLSPQWFSTMFPVYFFAASCCGYFALQVLMMFFIQRRGRLHSEITTEHYQDAGKMLFAFGIVFWAYIAYSQYMLIWYANIPEETPWYLTRQMGGWMNVSILLLIGHFAGPFLFLISRHPKRAKATLAAAAGWMLFMHFIDIYWLVMPTVPLQAMEHVNNYEALGRMVTNDELGYGWHLLDLTCLIGLAGLLIAGTAKRLSGQSLIPERDPRLHESLAFENI